MDYGTYLQVTDKTPLNVEINNGHLMVNFNISSSSGGAFGFYNNDDGMIPIVLPGFASNKATRYEIWAVISTVFQDETSADSD